MVDHAEFALFCLTFHNSSYLLFGLVTENTGYLMLRKLGVYLLECQLPWGIEADIENGAWQKVSIYLPGALLTSSPPVYLCYFCWGWPLVSSGSLGGFFRPFPDFGGYMILTFIMLSFCWKRKQDKKSGIFVLSLMLMKAPCDWPVFLDKSGTQWESEFLPDGSNKEILIKRQHAEMWVG